MNQKSPLPGYLLAAAVIGTAFLALHKPAPGPGPIPPGPTPPPDPAGSFLVVVTDNDNRTPDQAALLLDEDLGKWLVEKKIGWRVIDCKGKVFTEQGYDKLLAADGIAPPAVVLWAKGNSTHRAAAAPTTAEAVKQWVMGSPHTGPPFIDVDGERRYLTCLPPAQARYMAPRGGEFSEVHAPLPRNQWREINNRNKFPSEKWVYDQDGIGSCVGNGATAALRKARLLAGMTDFRLAPGCTYAQINGGSDRGAVISDSLVALQQTGTIISATLGSDQKPYYTKQLPSGWKKEAARFRIEEAYHCSTFDDMATALQLGYIVVYGMQVSNSFNSFTNEGVAGASPGPGNHAMHADGLHKLASGEWAFDNVNSWGAAWGPWKNGRCYLVEKHFQQGDQPDAYAVKTAVEDPLDPIRPPRPKRPEQELEVVPGAAKPRAQDNTAVRAAGVCPCPTAACRCDADACKCGQVAGSRCAATCICGAPLPPPGIRPKEPAAPTRPAKSLRPDGFGYCSDRCTCGCNAGAPCRCGNGRAPQTFAPAAFRPAGC